jgi:hypothetical protein
MTNDQTIQLGLLVVGSIFTLVATVGSALIVSKLNLIHTTVNSNLAAQVQATQSERDANVALASHIAELNLTISQLIASNGEGKH